MFTKEEKTLVGEALKLYAQMIGQQYGPAEMQAMIPAIKDILTKMDKAAAGGTSRTSTIAPVGISEEWFQSVCQSCSKLGPSGCEDPVTAKWPGKCDPILTWERSKLTKP